MSARYFEGYYPALERRLEDHFSRVGAAFVLQGWRGALVLGGGYGRGEGGVMLDGGEPEFSNDLDYFLFDPAPEDPSLQGWCREIERIESAELGIDVEIKCLKADSIGDASRSMMFADLVAGHVVVAGDAGFLERMRGGLDFSKIAVGEATRLLWNRGSGMYFSGCRMWEDEAKTFVIRNHAKLKLALGDAWLCIHGLYTPQCRERGERLLNLVLPDELAGLKAWHAEGVEFKFRPFSDGLTWDELEVEAASLVEAWAGVYLMAEGRRMLRDYDNFAEYLDESRLIAGTSTLRNVALALRDRLKRGGYLRPVIDYPRGALMRALPCLLGLSEGGVAEAGRFLPSPAFSPEKAGSWEEIYAKWWACYA